MVNDQGSSFKWFLLITFSISWISFGTGILFGYLDQNTGRDVFYLIGAIGPSIAPLSLMFTYQNKEYNKNFWIRIYYPRKGPMWLVLSTVFLPIIMNMLFIFLSLIDSGPTFTFGNFMSKNGIFLIFSLIGILGWFGYAFPLFHKNIEELQKLKLLRFLHVVKKLKNKMEALERKILENFKKLSWIYTGLAIGGLWSIWNIPIAFILGSYPQSLGVSNFGFWEFFLLIPIQCLIISWVYVKTDNSTFVVLIFFLADITRLFFTIPLIFQIIRFILWILVAAFLILNELVLHLIPIPESK